MDSSSKEDLENNIKKINEELQAFDQAFIQNKKKSEHPPTESDHTQSLDLFVRRLIQGYHYLEAHKAHPSGETSPSARCLSDLHILKEQILSLHKNPNQIRKWTAHGQFFQKIFALSDEMLEYLYLTAQSLFYHKHFQESADALCLLTYINPTQPSLWLGYGHSEFCCQHYQAACIAYSLAHQIDPLNPKTCIYLSRCYEAMQQHRSAIEELDKAIHLLHDQPKNHTLKEDLLLHRNALETKLHSS